MPGIRHFSQENFTKRRFAASDRTRDPDDLSRLCAYRQSVKNLFSTRICAARLLQLQADRTGCLFFCFFRRLCQQRTDSFPRNVRFLYGVKQLRRLRGFDRKLSITG